MLRRSFLGGFLVSPFAWLKTKANVETAPLQFQILDGYRGTVIDSITKDGVLNIRGVMFTDGDGTMKYYWQGKGLHRDGGPAVIEKNGTEMWYQYNKLHRDDGPAIRKFDDAGTYLKEEHWHKHGLVHRADGPAAIHYEPDGSVKTEFWYLDGQRHRIGGPAIVDYATKTEEWFEDNCCHRIDGPAFICEKYQQWHYKGNCYLEIPRDGKPIFYRKSTNDYMRHNNLNIPVNSLDETTFFAALDAASKQHHKGLIVKVLSQTAV